MKIFKKVLIGIFSALFAIILLTVIASAVIINLTPRQLGVENIAIGGEAIEDIGLGDMKLISIYKSFNELTSVKEKDVVENPYNVEEEKKVVNEVIFKDSSISDSENFSSIISEKVTYPKQRAIKYTDTSLAYIFDNIVQNAAEGDGKAVQYLKDTGMSIREFTVSVKDGAGMIRIVCSTNLSSYKNQIEANLGAAAGFITIPEEVFLASEHTFTVDENGKIITSSKSLKVNNREDALGKAILSVVLSTTNSTADELNNKLGEVFSDILYNLGSIGVAETDDEGIVTGEVTYGNNGVSDHEFTFITHVEETEE